jgi:preprotein translocase subunit SecE
LNPFGGSVFLLEVLITLKTPVTQVDPLIPVIIMSKFGNYIQEAYDELVHKVTWPSWDELQQTTIIVLISLIIITMVIFGMDFAGENVLTLIYKMLGK